MRRRAQSSRRPSTAAGTTSALRRHAPRCCAISGRCSSAWATSRGPRSRSTTRSPRTLTSRSTPSYDKPDVHAAWDEARARGGRGEEEQRARRNRGARRARRRSRSRSPLRLSTRRSRAPARRPRRPPRVWIGVAGAIDIDFLPTGQDLCKLYSDAQPGNASNAYCTNPDGTDYPSRATPAENNALVQGKSGGNSGGARIGNIRAMLTFDYAATPS